MGRGGAPTLSVSVGTGVLPQGRPAHPEFSGCSAAEVVDGSHQHKEDMMSSFLRRTALLTLRVRCNFDHTTKDGADVAPRDWSARICCSS